MFDISLPPLLLLLILLELLRLNGTLVETPTRCIKTKNSRDERVCICELLFDIHPPAQLDLFGLDERKTVLFG